MAQPPCEGGRHWLPCVGHCVNVLVSILNLVQWHPIFVTCNDTHQIFLQTCILMTSSNADRVIQLFLIESCRGRVVVTRLLWIYQYLCAAPRRCAFRRPCGYLVVWTPFPCDICFLCFHAGMDHLAVNVMYIHSQRKHHFRTSEAGGGPRV